MESHQFSEIDCVGVGGLNVTSQIARSASEQRIDTSIDMIKVSLGGQELRVGETGFPLWPYEVRKTHHLHTLALILIIWSSLIDHM